MKIDPKKKEKLKSALSKNSFVVPEDVRKAAERGLALREKFGRGGMSPSEAKKEGIWSGVNTAKALISGKISATLVRRMRRYFTRHASDADAKGDESRGFWGNDSNPSNGWIAHLIWGGREGKSWVNSLDVE